LKKLFVTFVLVLMLTVGAGIASADLSLDIVTTSDPGGGTNP
jgi:hypothetical protein